MATFDIAVAGCGPGGLAAALSLARAGHRVTLVERFAAPRPVGSGLMIQPTGLHVLDGLGLGASIRTLAAPIRGLHGLSMPSRRVALAMSYAAIGDDTAAYGVHRALLFHVLFEAVQREDLRIDTGRTVVGSAVDGRRRRLRFDDGRESSPFDLVVDAMGARSTLARRARDLAYGALWVTLPSVPAPGIVADRLDQRYHRASQMAGVMPIGRLTPEAAESVAYFWSLRLDALDRWRREGLEAWRAEALALWPESAPLVEGVRAADQFVFASYQHRTLPSPVDTALAHVGDAWHATSPQLGQGANMALLDAEALAAALRDAGDVPMALVAYERRRRRHVRIYQAMSRLFTPAFQSNGAVLPWLRDRLVSPLDRVPLARRLTARIVAGYLGLDRV
jgi:2-polyprenyl-6-methoxyphenol hydroxylase-like FAD-dependent oxidoreductase